MRQFRSGLAAQLGGEPSFTQSLLIDRAAWLLWHVSELDSRTISIHEIPDREIRTYLAWSNTLTRCLGQLGVRSTKFKAAISATFTTGPPRSGP